MNNSNWDKTFEERELYSQRLLNKYPDRVPVIIENNKLNKSEYIIEKSKSKYLIPKELHVSELIILIRKNIKMDSSKAIFIFVDNVLVPLNSNVGSIYNLYKNPDGFLYVTFSCENTFG